jgi:hypothetical protein
MRITNLNRNVFSIYAAAAMLAACGGSQPPIGAPGVMPQSRIAGQAEDQMPLPKIPIVVGVTNAPLRQETLIDWPLRPGGGDKPQPLSGKLGRHVGSNALAADGDVIVMASAAGNVVTYDVATHAEKILSDPYGAPTDIAVDKKGNYYALNGYGNNDVTVYTNGSSKLSTLSCPSVYSGTTIAIDNKADVFVGGWSVNSSGYANKPEIFEYPAGSKTCRALHLRVPKLGGIGVDPKTDDLIATENPHPGSGQVLMLIFPKPYDLRTVIRRALHVTTAAFLLRLDADSTHIFYEDQAKGINKPLVDEAQYPSGKFEGRYQDGHYRDEYWVNGFTTIPNTLPN